MPLRASRAVTRRSGLVAPGLLSLSLSLSLSLVILASPARGQSATGFAARGTVTVETARGTESGAITVESWDAGHCRETLDLSRPGRARKWQATLDGKRVEVTGPADLVRVLPVPDAAHGCALLPSGQAGNAAWQSDSGSARLTIAFTSVIARGDFTEADFAVQALKSPAPPPTHGYPGGGE